MYVYIFDDYNNEYMLINVVKKTGRVVVGVQVVVLVAAAVESCRPLSFVVAKTAAA